MEPPASPANPPPPVPAIPFDTPAAPVLAPREIAREFRDLRYLVQLTMGILVVLLVTTTLVLFHQIRSVMAQAGVWNTTSIELTKAVTDYETNMLPHLNRMFLEFERYAQTDPDFAKLMIRYRVAPESLATNAPAAAPPSAPTGR